ncbi:SGNH/GDSL hydrolase family protein [Enterococcus sp. SMC-9]|uniref:SGNH/GDSL hydrolase family protein n=1 Tax=Enterococcus sp. SMC-9 TaxID=2862343 RepID=UPI001E2B96A4|nr:SGNH/GDSL hydrolase family protein [Enterococcus sp. SMC-9]MCD1023564.1 SGNH/GDSL hydrolase family protein [Enterococcus sp. SMC-9]
MKFFKPLITLLSVGIGALLIYIVLNQTIPQAKPILKPAQVSEVVKNQKEKLHFVAIGDSLTEGIGDETKRGGFVPIVTSDITERYRLTSVEVENYGVAGERSDQILTRMKKEESILANVATADILTLTVGGNDLMKVIQDNFFGLSIKTFKRPQEKYQKRVAEIIALMQKQNKNAPIYVFGIYNPFYLNFPEITDMQKIVDNWNLATEETTKTFKNVYFIPINDLLYRGLDSEVGIDSTLDSSTEDEIKSSDSSDLNIVDNNALYDQDKFHPNNLGYQLMANALRDELIKTQAQWLIKK